MSIRAKNCKICHDDKIEQIENLEDRKSLASELLNNEDYSNVPSSLHVCSKFERELWCANHRIIGSFYAQSRVTNIGNNKALFKNLKCELCKNLLRKPVHCNKCNTNFCRVCISNELLINDCCPKCE